MVVSLIASVYETKHDSGKASEAWHINDQFLIEAVDKEPQSAFEFAVGLVTLPQKPDQPEYEWLRRYLLGKGLTILADGRLTERLANHINYDPEGQFLYDMILKSMLVSAGDWNTEKIYSTPESFNLFAALAVGFSLEGAKPLSGAWTLCSRAQEIKEKMPNIIKAFKDVPEASRLTAIIESVKS